MIHQRALQVIVCAGFINSEVSTFGHRVSSCLVYFKRRRLNRELLSAVSAGQTDMVSRLLDQGANVNASDGHDSALCRAGRDPRSNAETLKLLLDRGASINEVPVGKGVHPLVRAAHWSTDERICLLIQAGADVNAVHCGTGNAPLWELVSWAQLETIELLLSKGADVNHQSCRGRRTALHQAAASGRPDVVQLLIQRGADPSLTDREGQTALAWAKQISSDDRQSTPELRQTIAYLESVSSGE